MQRASAKLKTHGFTPCWRLKCSDKCNFSLDLRTGFSKRGCDVKVGFCHAPPKTEQQAIPHKQGPHGGEEGTLCGIDVDAGGCQRRPAGPSA